MSKNKKIRLYCDFGGVFLSPSSEDAKDVVFENLTSKRLLERARNSGGKIHRYYHQESIDAFNALMQTGRYEVYWLTTWGENNDVISASKQIGLEIPDYRVITPELYMNAVGKKNWTAWKSAFIISDQNGNGVRPADPVPFVWIDDTAPEHWGDEVQGHCRERSKIISPGVRGLTKKNVADIIDWTLSLK